MSPRTVLVTGASSGIGRATALALSAAGFRVRAGVRDEVAAEGLAAEGATGLEPVMLDVTRADDIERVARSLADEGGLHGLVNNAGVYLGGALELMKPQEIRVTFEVNVIGLLLLTRACLPMLRASGGRVVNISSISGLVAMPGASAYAASKHAVEAATTSLRNELAGLGVRVIAVEPGAVDTEIWRKGRERDAARREGADDDVEAAYRPLTRLVEKLNAKPRGIAPETVAGVVVEALDADDPDNHYLVGRDAKIIALFGRLPEGVRDRVVRRKVWG